MLQLFPTLVRSISAFTNPNPIPLEAPFTTNTALGSWFLVCDVLKADSFLEKSISGKIGVPFDSGGSGGIKEDNEDDLKRLKLGRTRRDG